MSRVLVTVVVEVNREQVPGAFYDPQEFADHSAKAISHMLIAYQPEVKAAYVEDVPEEK